ncbi:MAG: hypothetical protein ACYSW4_08150, partial [Planctomycetota bacterium]
DKYGVVQAAPGAGVFGPYVKSIPKNPFGPTGLENSVEEDGTVGNDSDGWHYTTVAGVDQGHFQADDSGVNALDNNKAHEDY